MLKKCARNGATVLIFTGIWVILHENFSLAVLFSGVVASAMCLLVTDRFLYPGYISEFSVPFPSFVSFSTRMILQIYQNGWRTAVRCLAGDITPTMVEYHSRLTDSFPLRILANSITLTPGTVTVSRTGQQLLILSADRNADCVREDIRKHLEEGILPMEGKTP